MSIQWPLVVFTVLAGTGAALYAAAIIGYLGRKPAAGRLTERSVLVMSVVSIVLLIAGGTASAFHLSHVERMLKALNHPTSGIFMEALFLGILVVLIAVFVVVVRRRQGEVSTSVKAVGAIGAVIALAYLFILGYLYMMPARPAWNTPLLTLTYAGTAASSGFALYLLLTGAFHEEKAVSSFAGTMLGVAAAASTVVALAYAIGYGGLFGDALTLFWICPVLLGSVVPAVCGFAARRYPERTVAIGAVAFACALAGCVGARAAMWLAGEAVKNMHALPRY